MISETDDGFQIISDEKRLLLPTAELAHEFKKDGQPVMVSGILKAPRKVIRDGFSVTPIEISELNLQISAYEKSDITLSIIKSEDHGGKPGFGYFIEDQRSPSPFRTLQYLRPAVPGLDAFCSWEQATKTAICVIYQMRKARGFPSLTAELLDYIHVLNPCNQLGR
jgi:hypothetical protein